MQQQQMSDFQFREWKSLSGSFLFVRPVQKCIAWQVWTESVDNTPISVKHCHFQDFKALNSRDTQTRSVENRDIFGADIEELQCIQRMTDINYEKKSITVNNLIIIFLYLNL